MRIAIKPLIVTVSLLTVLAGCGRDRDNIVQESGPEALYERGVSSMSSGNFQLALGYFQALEQRFPFSNVTRQAQLDMVYAYYRSRQFESAIDAAEEFERENPTHPRVDYCLYMKGLAYFDEAPGLIERLFRVDMTERPPRDTMQAFSIFQELLRRFPSSQYAPDARERMIFLRNRLAAYENHVAAYYMTRGAYVAAVNRAKYSLEHYPGAPALEESLTIMVDAYEQLGMRELAEDAQRVLVESFGELAALD
ncbi:MAG: outer membrane protein assembly factor BamD [Gammaproteobacteria bacterium]